MFENMHCSLCVSGGAGGGGEKDSLELLREMKSASRFSRKVPKNVSVDED